MSANTCSILVRLPAILRLRRFWHSLEGRSLHALRCMPSRPPNTLSISCLRLEGYLHGDTPTMTNYCAHCGTAFEPRPQVRNQSFCSSPGCQRARKTQWQRAKRKSDPVYRDSLRDAHTKWAQNNPDYWRNRSRLKRMQERLQHISGQDQQPITSPIKIDVCTLPMGLYRITRHPSSPEENGLSWIAEITPVVLTCPRKMDVSTEDFIDISVVRK